MLPRTASSACSEPPAPDSSSVTKATRRKVVDVHLAVAQRDEHVPFEDKVLDTTAAHPQRARDLSVRMRERKHAVFSQNDDPTRANARRLNAGDTRNGRRAITLYSPHIAAIYERQKRATPAER
jgi:hypothetical protein